MGTSGKTQGERKLSRPAANATGIATFETCDAAPESSERRTGERLFDQGSVGHVVLVQRPPPAVEDVAVPVNEEGFRNPQRAERARKIVVLVAEDGEGDPDIRGELPHTLVGAAPVDADADHA